MMYARHTWPTNLPHREPDGVWVRPPYERPDGTRAEGSEHPAVIISRHRTLEAAVWAGWGVGIQISRLERNRCVPLAEGEYEHATVLHHRRTGDHVLDDLRRADEDKAAA